MRNKLVSNLQSGDMIDLFGDAFADPNKDPSRSFKFEFETVLEVKQETHDCFRVDFESGFSCGFPPNHEVRIGFEL
jgi:hypothetical protein